MRRKILLGLGAAGTALALIPLFAAFEAHVINVTAKIENALGVNTNSINFGTVFPEEHLFEKVIISLSESFRAEDRVDDVTYVIKQKPKCIDDIGNYVPVDPITHQCPLKTAPMPLLCPYLSKEKQSDDKSLPTDRPPFDTDVPALHGDPNNWDPNATSNIAKGKLTKLGQDFEDKWDIDLLVPCFIGECAQDNVIPPLYQLDPSLKGPDGSVVMGCDLWVEVAGISLPGGLIPCIEKLDLMLVLDRSGSITNGTPGSELDTLKTAAKAFVDALAPAADGAHVGMVSFATDATLDEHLTSDGAAVKSDIDALVSGGTTNLEQAIEDATTELANPGDGHDRADGESPDFMVIITDGAPNTCSPACGPDGADGEAAVRADAARAAGIEVFVVGVGVTPDTETYLKTEIADDASHYFSAADFDDLQAVLEALVACD